ncbi:hypothetical protein [Lichenifustis flavocetrariae]|uniref:Uncharacterized protein n=1 Tax=Lichenifustis flavocetrariae TaxID=2949735 RepID=A0AA41YVN8_9HYPH|nr:hypothetical protein [Lichenifustis flavocetrariae]MCW6509464.1 hypothetical protein [Lichenifustis flavocetrariae]
MIHNLQALLATIYGSVAAHLDRWDGWAVVIASLLFGLQRAPLWMPVVVALVIDPLLYGWVAGLLHGRIGGVEGLGLFTLTQIVVGYGGYAVGRLIARLR